MASIAAGAGAGNVTLITSVPMADVDPDQQAYQPDAFQIQDWTQLVARIHQGERQDVTTGFPDLERIYQASAHSKDVRWKCIERS